jgi:hypothetical protein
MPALRGDALRALAGNVERAAREVGRFRRRVQADPELERFRYLADRLADDIEWALLILTPSAGELTSWVFPGDSEAADAAIEVVDARSREIRSLLGDARKKA